MYQGGQEGLESISHSDSHQKTAENSMYMYISFKDGLYLLFLFFLPFLFCYLFLGFFVVSIISMCVFLTKFVLIFYFMHLKKKQFFVCYIKKLILFICMKLDCRMSGYAVRGFRRSLDKCKNYCTCSLIKLLNKFICRVILSKLLSAARWVVEKKTHIQVILGFVITQHHQYGHWSNI